MCSISGFVTLGSATPDPEHVCAEFHNVFLRGLVRGKDSFGVAAVSRKGEIREWRGFQPPGVADLMGLMDGVSALIANTRAVPTTEWARGRDPRTIQPFAGGNWVASHNGTIANDRELFRELDVTPEVAVDSAVLPWLFSARGLDRGLAAIRGSFALAAINVVESRKLYLGRNFKPLHLMHRGDLGVFFFASLPEQLAPTTRSSFVDLTRPRIENLAPYSYAILDGDSATCCVRPLPGSIVSGRRALVIASGGLDSTVAAAKLLRDGFDVTLLHFSYGCHAEPAELRASRAVAAALGCDHRTVPLDWLGRLGGSTLTVKGSTITPCEIGAEYPHEWVPARNMLMIAHACAIADAEGFTHIALGTNLEEGGSYPDNTQEFVGLMGQASVLGTTARAQILAPVGNLVKHEIVRLGVELQAPLDRTWSCYLDGDLHCGRCGPCFMRRVAFEANGLVDPIQYSSKLGRLRPIADPDLARSC